MSVDPSCATDPREVKGHLQSDEGRCDAVSNIHGVLGWGQDSDRRRNLDRPKLIFWQETFDLIAVQSCAVDWRRGARRGGKVQVEGQLLENTIRDYCI